MWRAESISLFEEWGWVARSLLINPGWLGVFALVVAVCETARHAGKQ